MEYRDLKEAYRADKQIYWHDNMVDYINWLEDKIIDSQTNWISVEDRLPENFHLNMSRDVLTIAGKYKMKVSSYDYELKRWNGYNHVSPTHWQPLPTPPHL